MPKEGAIKNLSVAVASVDDNWDATLTELERFVQDKFPGVPKENLHLVIGRCCLNDTYCTEMAIHVVKK